jgi:hypothetical protein
MLIDEARSVLECKVWSHPDSYEGYSPDGDYIIYSRHRDSGILDESNYELILQELRALIPESWEGDSDPQCEAPCHDFRASHWAVGWLEHIIVKASAPEDMIIRAAEIIEALDDYPVYNEMDYSDRQYKAVCDYWDNIHYPEK